MLTSHVYHQPIPTPYWKDSSLENARDVKIMDNQEPLIPVSLSPEKILVRPQYFIQGIQGAMSECYLREGVYNKLLEAVRLLPNGYRLIIFDGWRPAPVQEQLYKRLCKELSNSNPQATSHEIETLAQNYVAPPSENPVQPAPHITGGAVDLSIVDQEGFLLTMGSTFDETDATSRTRFYEDKLESGSELSEAEELACKNRRFLYNIMAAVGFSNYPEEWWHFDYGNQNWAYFNKQQTAHYGIAYPAWRWGNVHGGC